MTISSYDFNVYKVYKGLEDIEGQGAECLECIYPELRHFDLPNPRSLRQLDGDKVPLIPESDPTSAPTLLPTVSVSSEPSSDPTNHISSAPSITTSPPTVDITNTPSAKPSIVQSDDDVEQIDGSGETDDAGETDDVDSTESTEDIDDAEKTDDTEDAGDTDDIDDIEDTEHTEDTDDTDDTDDVEDTEHTEDTEDTEDTEGTEDSEDSGNAGEETVGRTTTTPCSSSNNGSFFISETDGVVNNIINYKYQMELAKDSANISTEVLPVLEKALLDKILPNLFIDECGSRRLFEEYQRNHMRRLSIVGASSKPVDVESSDGKNFYNFGQYIDFSYSFFIFIFFYFF